MIKVRFLDNDSRILPEMSAKVALLSHTATAEDQKSKIVLNPSAIIKSNGRDAVYLLGKNIVHLTPVTVGARFGELIEISGVKPGDKVALRPLNKLKDGKKVTVTEK
jgi:hypothetical protein